MPGAISPASEARPMGPAAAELLMREISVFIYKANRTNMLSEGEEKSFPSFSSVAVGKHISSDFLTNMMNYRKSKLGFCLQMKKEPN